VIAPVMAVGVFPRFVQIAAGEKTMCARTNTNQLYCSGDGALGQTGNGGTFNVLTEVIAGATIWQWGPYIMFETVIAALNAVFPLDLRSWGSNDYGQGGAGNAGVDMLVPTIPTYLPTTFSTYSIGSFHACGIGGAGAVYCIGDNNWGRCFCLRRRASPELEQ
jgi:alpha-tubulin suppressor-like RCC1 family protein